IADDRLLRWLIARHHDGQTMESEMHCRGDLLNHGKIGSTTDDLHEGISVLIVNLGRSVRATGECPDSAHHLLNAVNLEERF
ncbi:hypothetical protein PFISCL1PPCAC_2177, partial [Pristionchus fissidentatus]